MLPRGQPAPGRPTASFVTPGLRAERGAPSDLTVFLDSHLRRRRRDCAMPPMNELDVEMKVLTWLLWLNMALILAGVAVAVLREFG
jgi:hypothetical protein